MATNVKGPDAGILGKQHTDTDLQSSALPNSLDGFVSYRRADAAAVMPIVRAVEAIGRDLWIDTVDIPAGTLWRTELLRAIEVSSAVICFVTPDWLRSEECRRELEYAVSLNKRLIPVDLTAPGELKSQRAEIADALRAVQWLPTTNRTPQQIAAEVIAAIDIDSERVRDHTYWLGRAIRWNERSRDRSLLVRGKDLRAAEEWIQKANRDPHPTGLQQEFVTASRRGERRRLRSLLIAAAVATIVSLTAAGLAFYQRSVAVQQRNTATSRALAASATEELGVDPELSVALAQAAWRTSPTAQALTALRRSLTTSRVRRTIVSGSPSVSHVALTGNGNVVISMGADGWLRSWVVGTGALRGALYTGTATPSMSVDRDGTLGVSWDGTGRGVVWSMDSGTGQFTEVSVQSKVSAAAVSGDGHTVVLGLADGTVQVSTDGAVKGWHVGPDEYPTAVAVSDNGRTVVAGTQMRSWDKNPVPGTVGGRVRSFDNKGRVSSLWQYQYPVAELTASTDGATIFSFAQDGSGILEKADGTGSPTKVSHAFEAAMDPTGRSVAVSDIAGQLALEQVGGQRVVLSSAGAPYRRLLFDSNGSTLVGVDTDAIATVWNTTDGSVREKLPQAQGGMNDAALDSQGRLVTAHVDGTVRVWELPAAPIRLPAGNPSGSDSDSHTTGLAVQHDGKTVITASGDGLIQAWRSDNGKNVCLAGRLQSGWCAETVAGLTLDGMIAVNNTGTRLAVMAKDGGVTFLALDNGAKVVSRAGPTGTAAVSGSIAYSPDGTLVLAQRGTGPPRLLRPESGAVAATLDIPSDNQAFGVNLAFLPDGQAVVAAWPNGDLDLYGLDGRLIRRIGNVSGVPLAVAVAPDGGTIAVGVGKQIQLRDVHDGHLIGTLTGHDALVDALSYSADGFLVSGSADPTVRVWDPATQAQFDEFTLPVGAAEAVAFVPGATTATIAAAGGKQSAFLFNCDVCGTGSQLSEMATGRVTRPLTDAERVRFDLNELPR